MHELSLALGVREIVEQAARENGASSVREVVIAVGKFSSVVPQSMSFAMDTVKKKTVFENAEIIIKEIDVTLRCKDCGEESLMKKIDFSCALCGSPEVEIISGDRMFVESIDILREDEKCTT